MKRMIPLAVLAMAAAACQKAGNQAQQQNAPTPAAPVAPAAPQSPASPDAPQAPPAPQTPAAPKAPAAPEPGSKQGLPDDKTPLPEPNGPIDPKSAEAAGQVVQHYAALIEERKFAAAEKLWGDAAAAKRETAELEHYSDVHLQVGKPFDMEGAAGSSYISVPVALNGKLASDAIRHRSGTAILRRVNDVPGSTEAQRHWHIERIDWKN